MSLGYLRALFITDPLIIIATIILGSINLAASLFETDGRRQVAIARFWSRLILRIAGVRLTLEGLEKIDPNGSYVFASNHLSFMDTPVVLGRIPVQFRFLAKQGLFKIPFLGYHLQRAGHIPVPRENPVAALKSMGEAARLIRERGISVLVFPEGGRSLEGLKPFKEGAAYIAIKAGAPAVPLALLGTLDVLPMGSLHMRPGHVTLRVGDPIPTAHMTLKERSQLTQTLHDRVAELLGDKAYEKHTSAASVASSTL